MRPGTYSDSLPAQVFSGRLLTRGSGGVHPLPDRGFRTARRGGTTGSGGHGRGAARSAGALAFPRSRWRTKTICPARPARALAWFSEPQRCRREGAAWDGQGGRRCWTADEGAPLPGESLRRGWAGRRPAATPQSPFLGLSVSPSPSVPRCFIRSASPAKGRSFSSTIGSAPGGVPCTAPSSAPAARG